MLLQENVSKLEEVVNFDRYADPTTWRSDEGPTVGLVMTPAATTAALAILADWKTYCDPTAFLRDSMRQIASGLAHVHGLHMLHRDIKPENIVYCSVYPVRAVIIDFGCSSPTSTSTRHDRGTVTYLAPEVMRIKLQGSEEPFSYPSDVWSLGVTLLDFLVGRRFSQNLGTESCYQSLKESMNAHDAEDFPEFWDLILKLLGWDPKSRPTAVEIAARFPERRSQGKPLLSLVTEEDEDVPSKRTKV
jgi:serine/threonine protein kinase